MTSTAGTRPSESERFTSRWLMTARSTAANCSRICFCSGGGKMAIMRLMVSTASRVCKVEKTMWPVSAACSAVPIVSRSRISPTRITSGSWRSEARSAVENEGVSTSTSRWFT